MVATKAKQSKVNVTGQENGFWRGGGCLSECLCRLAFLEQRRQMSTDFHNLLARDIPRKFPVNGYSFSN